MTYPFFPNTLGHAQISHTAWISGVINVATFFFQDVLHGAV
jgi:hypothetical protein